MFLRDGLSHLAITVRNSTAAAAAAAAIISLLDLELAKKNREIKTIGKIDTRPQSTKMAARGYISSFASYLAEHPITDERDERERVPLAPVCCLVRYCVGCSASKSSRKWGTDRSQEDKSHGISSTHQYWWQKIGGRPGLTAKTFSRRTMSVYRRPSLLVFSLPLSI